MCQTLTACAAGHYPVVAGDAFHDRQCGPCPAGQVGQADGLSCVACTGSAFSGSAGRSNCTACTDCQAAGAAVSRAYECPTAANCSRGYLSLCNATTDAVCMHCPLEWTKDVFGVCTPCETGYYHDATNYQLHLLQRCVLCPSNMYCDSPDTFSRCPHMIAVERNAAVVFVPSSPSGSSRVFQCVCNVAGGFEGTGASISGCRPCQDGYYAAAGDAACTRCPVGTYSSRQTVRDLFACPLGSNLLVGPNGVAVLSPTVGICEVCIYLFHFCSPYH